MAKTGDIADANLSKMRLMGKKGVILIPPNCGQELWDVIEISDSIAAQSNQKYRIIGIQLNYNLKSAEYYQLLKIGEI
jgi:hypothetical protein